MLKVKELSLQYITDQTGEKTAVILPLEEFQELIEDIEDLAVVAKRHAEPTVSHNELLAELKSDGLLQD
jgi:PHD/YefM family antitoxin component YafN of YafNO toxin-antitoxin module